MNKHAKIYVAGHRGLVGSAICRALEQQGYDHVVVRGHAALDLTDLLAVKKFFDEEQPEYVFLAAAKVGGILANRDAPVEFMRDNLKIELNVIDEAYRHQVKRLLFLGSSCIYPRLCPQPIKEEYLLTGELEPTNEAYAIAKIAGLKLCQFYNQQYGTSFIALMPTNLYGPHDNFDLKTSHVLPALLRKFHEAKMKHEPFVTIWGSGQALREFLYIDDLAEACVFVMNQPNDVGLLNVGTGEDLSIRALAELIKNIVGFQGEIQFDHTKPDGTPRKLLNVEKIFQLGWRSKITLEEGIRMTYEWYLINNK
jgi:GDP-L-fucose synthase